MTLRAVDGSTTSTDEPTQPRRLHGRPGSIELVRVLVQRVSSAAVVDGRGEVGGQTGRRHNRIRRVTGDAISTRACVSVAGSPTENPPPMHRSVSATVLYTFAKGRRPSLLPRRQVSRWHSLFARAGWEHTWKPCSGTSAQVSGLTGPVTIIRRLMRDYTWYETSFP